MEQHQIKPELSSGTFKEFLADFITLRFSFYDQNPAIARLVSWQRLENDRDELEGIQNSKMSSILSQIKEFQQRGQIRKEMTPEMIEYLIMNMTTLPFMAKDKIFEENDGKKNKQKYIHWIIDTLHDRLLISS